MVDYIIFLMDLDSDIGSWFVNSTVNILIEGVHLVVYTLLIRYLVEGDVNV